MHWTRNAHRGTRRERSSRWDTMSEHDERGPIPGLDDTAERPAVRDEPEYEYQRDETDVDQADYDEAGWDDDGPRPRGGTRRAERRGSRVPGCLAVLVALAVVAVVVVVGLKAFSSVKDKLDGLGGSGGDYSGQTAHDSVTFEVKPGDTAAA